LRGAFFCFMTGPHARTQKLSKTYRTGDKALQNVTLTVPKARSGADRAIRRGQVDADPLHQPAG
jgi:hypothetical protein